MGDWTEAPPDVNDANAIRWLWEAFQVRVPDEYELPHATLDAWGWPWEWEAAWKCVGAAVPRERFLAFLSEHYPSVPTAILYPDE